MTGLTLTTAAYHGNTRTNALYKGTKKIWPPEPPPPGGGPEQISGCILALDATDVPAGSVTSWPDRTEKANNLVPLSGTPVSTGEYVTCTTANVLRTTNTIDVTGAAPRHLFTMVRSRWVGGSFMGYGLGANAALFDLWYFTGQGTLIWHGYGGGFDTVAGAPPFTADQWHLVELSYDGSTMRVYMDEGAPQVSSMPGLVTAASQFLFGVGRYSPAGDFDMKSFYFYDRVLNDTERAQVRAHMVAEPEPPWAPDALAGLAVWFDAVDYLPGSWPNKIPSGAAPVWKSSPAAAWSVTTQNGLPVVRLKPNEARLRIHSPDSTGVHMDWTLVYVARMVGPTAGRVVDAIYPPSNLLVGFWNGMQDVMYDNGFASNSYVSVVLGAWKMYSGDGTTGLSRLFSDGALLGSTATAAGWNGTFAISGYSQDGGEETCDCEIAEVLQWNRKLSDEERQQVETYLREKWAVT